MAGFFSSLFGGGNSASGYAKKQNKLIDRNSALVDALSGSYHTAAAAGAFDPNTQLDQLRADTAYQTRVQSGNAAAAARTLGYRPGDSEPLLAQRAMSEKAALDYDRLANGIRQQALQGGLSAASSLAGQSSNILGQSLGANGQMLQNAQAQDAQAGAALGQLLSLGLPFLSRGPSRAPKGNSSAKLP